MVIFLCILSAILLALFSYVVWIVVRVRNQTRKELSASSDAYGDPAGEPLWFGILPQRVDDYVEPRYVYENLEESCDYLPENGRIIGYRISPELVIHSRIKFSLNLHLLAPYIVRYGGKLLNLRDCGLLLNNWDKISQLREKSGDTPLNIKCFWASSEQLLPIRMNVSDRSCDDVMGLNDVYCALILKR